MDIWRKTVSKRVKMVAMVKLVKLVKLVRDGQYEQYDQNYLFSLDIEKCEEREEDDDDDDHDDDHSLRVGRGRVHLGLLFDAKTLNGKLNQE